jgi:hypothetical protein
LTRRVLEPIDRVSEILFGLIMVLTFTGSLSAAEAGRADVRAMLVAALGCNLAWGIEEWLGALGVFLLVFLSTFPVAIPFLFVHEPLRALRLSNAVALVMLYLTATRSDASRAIGAGSWGSSWSPSAWSWSPSPSPWEDDGP